MHGYNWGYRGIPRTGGFACLTNFDSPLGYWLMIGFMALVVVAIVLLVVGMIQKHAKKRDESEAMVIIRRRYAQGELTFDEYSRMKKDLQ